MTNHKMSEAIDQISSLTIPQLDGLKKDLQNVRSTLPFFPLRQQTNNIEKQLQNLADSYTTVKAIQAKYTHSLTAVQTLSQTTPGTKTLVPVASSVYIPATISNTQTVLVDVGTGYFLQKTIPSAQTFLKEKVNLLTTESTKISNTIQKTEGMLRLVMESLQMRIMQERK